MLRTSHNVDYMKQVKNSVGGLFLSDSYRNKKYDGDHSKMSSFDFSEIQQILKSKTLKQFLNHEQAPVVLICVVCAYIGILYFIMAAFSSALLLNYDNTNLQKTPITSQAPQYNNDLIMEIEEVISKLMDLKKHGNMKEYEAFFEPTMQKYCLNHIGNSFLDLKALESFHMNLAETISFISRGGKFTEHESLTVTRDGGIIDPSNSKEPAHVIKDATSCPLLEAIYKLGAAEATDTANDSKADKDGEDENKDNDAKFDKRYSWENMEEFLGLMLRSLTKKGECLRIAKELSRDNMKSLIMNFYEMTEIIGAETQKEVDAGVEGLYDFKPEEREDYKKYVFGRDGGIYETDKYETDTDEYLRCTAIERILNDKFLLNENLSYTNVKIMINEKFGDWYDDKLKKKIE